MKKMKKNNENFQVILLRGECPPLEQALNNKLTQNPNFLENYNDYNDLNNNKLSISNDWGGLTFLAIKGEADIHNFSHKEVLLYVDFCIRRPQNTVGNLALISFSEDLELTLKISGNILNRLYDVYNIDTIAFSCKEGATIYRLFNKAKEYSNRYFPNWVGRHIGYYTKGGVDQAGRLYNSHLFEILRKNEGKG